MNSQELKTYKTALISTMEKHNINKANDFGNLYKRGLDEFNNVIYTFLEQVQSIHPNADEKKFSNAILALC